jgi:hypothetical protein
MDSVLDHKAEPPKTKRRSKISKPVRIVVLLLLHQRSQHREEHHHLQMDSVPDHKAEMLKRMGMWRFRLRIWRLMRMLNSWELAEGREWWDDCVSGWIVDSGAGGGLASGRV